MSRTVKSITVVQIGERWLARGEEGDTERARNRIRAGYRN